MHVCKNKWKTTITVRENVHIKHVTRARYDLEKIRHIFKLICKRYGG